MTYHQVFFGRDLHEVLRSEAAVKLLTEELVRRGSVPNRRDRSSPFDWETEDIPLAEFKAMFLAFTAWAGAQVSPEAFPRWFGEAVDYVAPHRILATLWNFAQAQWQHRFICVQPQVKVFPKLYLDAQTYHLHILVNPEVASLFPGRKQPFTAPMSDAAPVSLDPKARELAGIPERAQTYCFAYPCLGDCETRRLSAQSSLWGFLTLGGFFFLDDRNQLVQVSALQEIPGEREMAASARMLYLNLASPVNHELLSRITVHHVARPFLGRAKLSGIAWVSPCAAGELSLAVPHGGFVVTHSDDAAAELVPVFCKSQGLTACPGSDEDQINQILQSLASRPEKHFADIPAMDEVCRSLFSIFTRSNPRISKDDVCFLLVHLGTLLKRKMQPQDVEDWLDDALEPDESDLEVLPFAFLLRQFLISQVALDWLEVTTREASRDDGSSLSPLASPVDEAASIRVVYLRKDVSLPIATRDGEYFFTQSTIEGVALPRNAAGRLSRVTAVPADVLENDKAGVPYDAAWYCFAYPIPEVTRLPDLKPMDIPAHAFLVAGGFLYLGEQNEILQVSALSFMESRASRPLTLSSPKAVSRALMQSRPTIAASHPSAIMARCVFGMDSVDSFQWIPPELEAEHGIHEESSHGAFLVCCRAPSRSYVLFRVLCQRMTCCGNQWNEAFLQASNSSGTSAPTDPNLGLQRAVSCFHNMNFFDKADVQFWSQRIFAGIADKESRTQLSRKRYHEVMNKLIKSRKLTVYLGAVSELFVCADKRRRTLLSEKEFIELLEMFVLSQIVRKACVEVPCRLGAPTDAIGICFISFETAALEAIVSLHEKQRTYTFTFLGLSRPLKVSGMVSPPRPVELDPEARNASRIPSSAVTSAFMYPAKEHYVKLTCMSGTPAPACILNLLSNGAFVYLDKHHNVVLITVIAPEPEIKTKALYFSPAQNIPEALLPALEGRLAPVGRPVPFAGADARTVCWLPPGDPMFQDLERPVSDAGLQAGEYLWGLHGGLLFVGDSGPRVHYLLCQSFSCCGLVWSEARTCKGVVPSRLHGDFQERIAQAPIQVTQEEAECESWVRQLFGVMDAEKVGQVHRSDALVAFSHFAQRLGLGEEFSLREAERILDTDDHVAQVREPVFVHCMLLLLRRSLDRCASPSWSSASLALTHSAFSRSSSPGSPSVRGPASLSRGSSVNAPLSVSCASLRGRVATLSVTPVDGLKLKVSNCYQFGDGAYVVSNSVQLLGARVFLKGHTSPCGCLTLDGVARSQACVPASAKFQLFAYPLNLRKLPPEVRRKILRLRHSDPPLAFLAQGGFVYLDDVRGKVV
eukprot:RCo046596